MRIAVFCSANENIDPEFFKMTEELGAWMAENHHALIFGGSNQGLMQCAARAVKEHGGHTIGVVPTLLEKGGKVSKYLDENIPSRTLSDRKDIMVKECDVAIALPGGVGTLDEIFCMAASKSIGYHDKKVILYNMKGFWDYLTALLEDMARKGMIRGSWRDKSGRHPRRHQEAYLKKRESHSWSIVANPPASFSSSGLRERIPRASA